MSRLVEEYEEWNTPLIGAFLLWGFNKSYVGNHLTGEAPVVIEDFIAYSLLMSKSYNERITNRITTIASYIQSFTIKKQSDILATLVSKINEDKEITLKAIDFAVSYGLLVWDCETAKLYPKSLDDNQMSVLKDLPIMKLQKKAEILGKWFSQVNLNTLLSLFGVVL